MPEHRCLNCGRTIDSSRVLVDQRSQTVYLDDHPLDPSELSCSPHCLGRLRRWRETASPAERRLWGEGASL